MVNKHIGENIRSIRKSLNMSQSVLAKKMNYCDKSMISKIEKGYIDLPQSKIFEFAKVLCVDVSEIMGTDNCYSEEENELFKIFNHLNDEGQEELLKYARLLGSSEQYKKHYQSGMVEEEA